MASSWSVFPDPRDSNSARELPCAADHRRAGPGFPTLNPRVVHFHSRLSGLRFGLSSEEGCDPGWVTSDTPYSSIYPILMS